MLKSLQPMARPMLVLMAFTAIFGITSDGYTNNEPPSLNPGEHLQGPATVGTLVMSAGPTFPPFPPGVPSLHVSFSGRCAQFDVSFQGDFQGFSFDKLLAAPDPIDQLKGRRIPTNLTLELEQCYSQSAATEMVINTVTRFSSTTSAATAEVVILAIKSPS